MRVNVGGSPLAFQVEPTMVINSQGKIFAGWKEAPTGTAGGQRVGFSYSTDGGMTWARNIIMRVVNPGNLQSDPWLTVTRDDRVFFTRIEYGTPDGIAVTNTTDGVTWGTTWFYDDSPNFADKESAAHDADGNLYWVWNTDSATQDLAFTRSNDGGASFVPKVIVSDFQGTIGGIVQTAPCGCVYATWWQYTTDNVMFDRSFDGGLTWGTDVRVNDIPGSAESPLGADFIVLPAMAVAPNGTIYVVWNDYRNGRPGGVPDGNSDTYISHSVDQGGTWSPAVRVNDDNSTARQFMPDLAIDPFGAVHVAWEDDRTGDHNIYYANSTDGGQTFGPNVRVSTIGTPVSYTRPGDYFAIEAAPNGTVAVVWTDGRNADLDIYFASLPRPNRSVLNTVPAGLSLQLDGNPVTAPYWFDCTPGTHTISALSPQGSGNPRYTFRSWSDGGTQLHTIACPSTGIYTANFAAERPVTIATSPPGLDLVIDGSVVPTPQTLWWEDGSVHTLDAASQVQGTTRYVFNFWSDGGAQNHTASVCAPDSFIAYFAREFEVTIATSPPGLNVTVDGISIVAPQSFWWGEGSSHDLEVPSPQTSPGTNAVFTDWSDGGAQNHTITAAAPGTFTANFGLQYRIVVDTQPASFQVQVDGNAYPAPYMFWCDSGTTHMIDAPTPTMGPGTRARFLVWSDGGPQNHAITCIGPETYIASFAFEHNLSFATSPPGLRVVVDSLDTATPYSLWCPDGREYHIDAPSPQGSGGVRNVFVSWSDAGPQGHTITCDGPKTLMANFRTEYQVSIATSPPGRQVLVDTNLTATPQAYWWPNGDSHDLDVPSPQGAGPSRFTFVSWSNGGAQSQTIVVSAPLTLIVTFSAEYLLVVQSEHGVVACTPADCWFDADAVGSFIVSPGTVSGTQGTRYQFAGWSGDSTAATASATIPMDAPKTVVAMWRTEHLLTIQSDHGDPQGGGWHTENEAVAVSVESTVTANGATYRFTGWSGDATSSDASFSLTMNAPKTIRASWEAVPPSQGVIGGLVLWLALLAVLLLLIVFFLWRRRRREEEPPAVPPEPPPT